MPGVSNFLNRILTSTLGTALWNAPLSISYITANNVKFEATADASAHFSKIEPNKMLATDAANIIRVPLKAKYMELAATSNFPGKINDIRIEDVVTKNSLSSIEISGKKTFSNGLSLSGGQVSIARINGEPSKDILEPNFVYTDPGTDMHGKYKPQTIQTKQVWYNNLIIKVILGVVSLYTSRNITAN